MPSTTRPPLPESLNPLLDASELPSPKFQQIERDGKLITIARLKIRVPASEAAPATPSAKRASANGESHSFILRRYDCDAISLTSMFKTAFPAADAAAEQAEASWVKQEFDCTLVPAPSWDGAKLTKLAGTWVPIDVAAELAPSYGLASHLPALVDAHTPDLHDYHTRQRVRSPSVAAPSSPAQAASSTLVVPSPKRRAASPAPTNRVLRSASPRVRSPSPGPAAASGPTTTPRQSKRQRKSTLPKSVPPPVPAAVPSEPVTVIAEETTTTETEVVVPAPEPAAEQQVAGPTEAQIAADIASSKALVSELKDAKQLVEDLKDSVSAEQPSTSTSAPGGTKRDREEEDDQPRLDLSVVRPAGTTADELAARPVVQRKKVAALVGVLAMGVGYAASNILPRFFF